MTVTAKKVTSGPKKHCSRTSLMPVFFNNRTMIKKRKSKGQTKKAKIGILNANISPYKTKNATKTASTSLFRARCLTFFWAGSIICSHNSSFSSLPSQYLTHDKNHPAHFIAIKPGIFYPVPLPLSNMFPTILIPYWKTGVRFGKWSSSVHLPNSQPCAQLCARV